MSLMGIEPYVGVGIGEYIRPNAPLVTNNEAYTGRVIGGQDPIMGITSIILETIQDIPGLTAIYTADFHHPQVRIQAVNALDGTEVANTVRTLAQNEVVSGIYMSDAVEEILNTLPLLLR